jgi:hypothetical protein
MPDIKKITMKSKRGRPPKVELPPLNPPAPFRGPDVEISEPLSETVTIKGNGKWKGYIFPASLVVLGLLLGRYIYHRPARGVQANIPEGFQVKQGGLHDVGF